MVSKGIFQALQHFMPYIIQDKGVIYMNDFLLLFFFSTKTYIVSTHLKRLCEALLVSTIKTFIFLVKKENSTSYLAVAQAILGLLPFT